MNPAARVNPTVSPVPLIATAEDRHVLVSTTYSKSVLRVAAEQLAQTLSDVHYFPSYEIVIGAFSRGSYFADDLRSVREEGVRHVMALFFKRATDGAVLLERPASSMVSTPSHDRFMAHMEEVVEVLCDEERLDPLHVAGSARGAVRRPAGPSGSACWAGRTGLPDNAILAYL